jgi:hypothetical protein
MVQINSGLAAKYSTLFQAVLRDNERLLTANASIFVQISDSLGRGAGDGTLGLTDQRIIHIGSKIGAIRIERSEIRSITKKWIVLPGSSQLDITVKKDGVDIDFSFYCGTGFCKDLLKIIGK